jgi:hypothetical protein
MPSRQLTSSGWQTSASLSRVTARVPDHGVGRSGFRAAAAGQQGRREAAEPWTPGVYDRGEAVRIAGQQPLDNACVQRQGVVNIRHYVTV